MSRINELVGGIKESIQDGDFENACDLCDELNENYPKCVSGWMFRIFIDNQAKTTKELIENGQDIRDSEAYQNIIKYGNVVQKNKITKIANSIVGIQNNEPETAQGLKQYMVSCIRTVENDIKMEKEERNNFGQEINGKMTLLAKKDAVFFSKNIFVFFLNCFYLSLPFLFLSLLFGYMEKNSIANIFLIACAVCLCLMIIIKFLKQKKKFGNTNNINKELNDLEERLGDCDKEIINLVRKRKKMIVVYKKFKARKITSSTKILAIKEKFDHLFQIEGAE